MVREFIKQIKEIVKIILSRTIWRIISKLLLIRKLKKNYNCLNIGCGSRVKSYPWINLDYQMNKKMPLYINISKKMKFRSESISYVYAEHVVEHIPQEKQIQFFKESLRVLKKGGILRIILPHINPFQNINNNNLNNLKTAYFAKKYIYNNKSDIINDLFRNHGHKYLWFEDDLIHELNKVGFVKVEKCLFREFHYEKQLHLDSHYLEVGHEIDDFESLRIEATK
jgi:predicted SAM-dependent methyltransferase